METFQHIGLSCPALHPAHPWNCVSRPTRVRWKILQKKHLEQWMQLGGRGVGWGRHSRAVQQSFAQPSTISLQKHRSVEVQSGNVRTLIPLRMTLTWCCSKGLLAQHMLGLGSNSQNPFPAACRAVGKQLAAGRAKVTKSKGCVVHSAKSISVGRISARVLPGLQNRAST